MQSVSLFKKVNTYPADSTNIWPRMMAKDRYNTSRVNRGGKAAIEMHFVRDKYHRLDLGVWFLTFGIVLNDQAYPR
jgi:hypothetical protein